MAKKRDLGKWSLICGIGSIVSPILFVFIFFFGSTLARILSSLLFAIFIITSFIIIVIGVVLGILSIVFYFLSGKKSKAGLVIGIVGLVLISFLIVTNYLVSISPEQPSPPISPDPPFAEDEKMIFPLKEITLGSGKSKTFEMGVKNLEETDLSFKIKVNLVAVQNNDKTETVNKEMVPSESDEFIGTFLWDESIQSLKPTEAEGYNVKFVAGDQIGIYLIQIVIEKENGEEYAEKKFFIRIE